MAFCGVLPQELVNTTLTSKKFKKLRTLIECLKNCVI